MAKFVILGRLPGLNDLVEAKHYQAKGRVKADAKQQVKAAVLNTHPAVKKFVAPVQISIACYEPNAKRDPDNVIGGASKVILDALQDIKVLQNDNQKHVARLAVYLAGVDRENPRIEVEIEEVGA